MPQYSKKKFLERINKSSLFKIFPVKPGEKDLKELGFSKLHYTESDLLLLRELFVEKQSPSTLHLPDRLDQAYRAFAKKIMPCLLLIANGKRKSLSLVSILCLVPEFEKMVRTVRLKYKIDPMSTRAMIYSSFHKGKQGIVANEIESEEKINPLLWGNCSKKEFNREVDQIKSVREKIRKIVKKKFPKLTLDIALIQERYGLPIQYEAYLRDYILFERISPWDILPINSTRNFQEKPDFQFNLSKKDVFTNTLRNSADFRPHISIKIYGSTNIDSVHTLIKILNDSGALRLLPTYNFKKTIPDLSAETILHKARLYYFHEVQKLKSAEIVELFRYLGKPVKKNNISRDIKAFKKVFHI